MKTRTLIIIAGIIAGGGLLLILAPFLATLGFYTATRIAENEYKEIAEKTSSPPAAMKSISMGEFRLNTADVSQKHFIKVIIAVRIDQKDEALAVEIADRKPQLRHIINLILSDKKKSELTTIQNQLELREEIKKSLNHILGKAKVHEIYFHEFIVN